MPIKQVAQGARRILCTNWFSGVLLFVSTPVLMFPTQIVSLTILILLVMLFWLVLQWWPTVDGEPKRTPLDGALLVLLIMVLVGMRVSGDVALTLPKLTNLLLGFVIFRWVALRVRTYTQVGWGIVVFLLLGMGMASLGVFSANWQLEIPLIARLISTLPPQLLALPGSGAGGVHLNQLAAVLALVFPVVIALMLTRLYEWRVRLPAGLLAFLLSGILLLTQSRGAWFGSAIGIGALLGFWFWVRPRALHRHPAFVGVLIVFVVALLVGGWQLREVDFESLWSEPPEMTEFGTFSTLSSRLQIWRWGVMGVLDFPWTGTGLGTFRQVVLRLYPLGSDDIDIAHAHNIFLQTALDLGLPGLVAYMALLGLTAKVAWQVARQDMWLRPVALGGFAGLVALHGFGLLDALTLGSRPGILFWLLLGLIVSMQKVANQQTTEKPAPDPTPTQSA